MRCVFVATEERNAKGWIKFRCSNPGCQIWAFSPHPPNKLICPRCQAGPPDEPPPVARVSVCAHLGAEELRREVCQTCAGKQLVKVFPCAVHGECTLGKQIAELACCQSCREYLPRPSFAVSLPAIRVRNLIYHVCPLKENDGWRQNVRQLLARVKVFNGRRVVAIATGEGLEEPQLVRREFEKAGGKWIFLELPNDRELREVATFLPLLLSVANTNSDEATFYAHTKGNSTADDPRGAALWRNMMYAKLLGEGEGEWPLCARELEAHALVGTHKIVWRPGQTPPYPTRLAHGHWMLAGTFFWFRHDLVFSRGDWRKIPADRYGAEAWPSGMFAPHEVKSVFQLWPESQYPSPNPYNPAIYREHVERGEFGPDEPLPAAVERIADGTELPAEAWEELVGQQRPRTPIAACSVLRPGVAGDKTAIVIGTFRGGTSFVAEQLAECGVPIGPLADGKAEDWAYCNFEDVEIAAALLAKDWTRFAELAAQRSGQSRAIGVWGFKWPGSVFVLEQILPLVSNPHLLVVTRDPLTAWQGDQARSAKVDLAAARHHAGAVLECLTRTRAPTLAISYERGKSQPGEVRGAVRAFLGVSSLG